MTPRHTPFLCWLACWPVLLIAACGPPTDSPLEKPPVHSFLEGRFTVSADVDSVPDYRGFEVLVAARGDGEPDTLGYATTDSTGAFRLDITAPERGFYALIVSRRGRMLKVDELAVADSDSAVVQATFPIGNRLLRIRSPENAAWAAYKNTKAQYNNLFTLLQNSAYSEENVRLRVEQTASILWNLHTTFPETMGAELAAAEAVMMLGGWNDSLALARAQTIPPDNLGYADVGRVARQVTARLYGQEAALKALDDFEARALDADQRAQLQTERVLALNDSLRHDEALATAKALAAAYPNTRWSEWAERAIYELENLLPGMQAPSLTVTTYDGQTVVLDSLRGQPVVVEFYDPQNQVFQRELPTRQALFDAAASSLRMISISVEPDTLLNEAFLEGRDLPGFHVFAPGRLDGPLARSYNINVIPTRYLIDTDGAIVGKYVGSAMEALQNDVLALLGNS